VASAGRARAGRAAARGARTSVLQRASVPGMGRGMAIRPICSLSRGVEDYLLFSVSLSFNICHPTVELHKFKLLN
jgi:hypothetical protein